MPSLSDKLRWRARFFLDGLTTHPRALLDSYFWKVLLRSSERTWSENFQRTLFFQNLMSLTNKLHENFSHGEILQLPIDYYEKRFMLFYPSFKTSQKDPMFQISETGILLELWLPYLERENQSIFASEFQNLQKLSYQGMAWEINSSPFKPFYLNFKQGFFWANEGPYDTPSIHLEEGD